MEKLQMNKTIGAAILVVGVILLFFGLSAGDSFASEFKEAITGNPTDRVIWLVVGGAALAVAGIVTLARSGRTASPR
jgi:hypothetical protein